MAQQIRHPRQPLKTRVRRHLLIVGVALRFIPVKQLYVIFVYAYQTWIITEKIRPKVKILNML